MTEPVDTSIIGLLREHKYSDRSDVEVYMSLVSSLEGDQVNRNRAIAAAEELNDRYEF